MPTTQPPAPKRRSLKVIVGLVAVVVVIATVVAFYVLKSSDPRYNFVDNRFRFSNEWVKGGKQAWVLTGVPETIDGPVAAQINHLAIVTKDPADPNGRVITVYDIKGNEPKLLWTRDIVIDPELEGPVMLVDMFVVYAGQIRNVYDGEIYDFPWAQDAKLVTEPTWASVVACVPDGDCSGNNRETGEEWRIPFEGTDIAPIIHDETELFTLMYSAGAADSPGIMINVWTGEWMRLKSPLDDVMEVTALQDGWLTYDSNFRPVLISLDGKVETLDTPGTGINDEKQRLLITPGPTPTLVDFRLQYTSEANPGKGRIVGEFDRGNCVFTIDWKRVDFSKEKSGARSLEGGDSSQSGSEGSVGLGSSGGSSGLGGGGGSSGSGGGDGCDTPRSFVGTSPDGNVISTLVMTEEYVMDYALLNASTGEVLWRVPLGDAVVVPRPDLAVTLDDGVLAGWSLLE